MHKTASSSSVPPGFAKQIHAKPTCQQPPLRFQGPALDQEWPVLAKKAGPLKIATPTRSVSAPRTPVSREPSFTSTSTKVAVPLTPSKLKGAAHKASTADKGKAVKVEEHESP